MEGTESEADAGTQSESVCDVGPYESVPPAASLERDLDAEAARTESEGEGGGRDRHRDRAV